MLTCHKLFLGMLLNSNMVASDQTSRASLDVRLCTVNSQLTDFSDMGAFPYTFTNVWFVSHAVCTQIPFKRASHQLSGLRYCKS